MIIDDEVRQLAADIVHVVAGTTLSLSHLADIYTRNRIQILLDRRMAMNSSRDADQFRWLLEQEIAKRGVQ